MRCTFCGHEFDAAAGRTHCEACLWSSGCRGVRCPRCGYEMPEELSLVKWFRNWRQKRDNERQGR